MHQREGHSPGCIEATADPHYHSLRMDKAVDSITEEESDSSQETNSAYSSVMTSIENGNLEAVGCEFL